ncbi:unnamed protein product [Musa hybrid cultivar]
MYLLGPRQVHYTGLKEKRTTDLNASNCSLNNGGSIEMCADCRVHERERESWRTR